MGMRAGLLNKRVTLQTATVTQNSYGEEVRAWVPIQHGYRWASVEPLSGAERFAAQQVNPSVSHKVTIRALPGVTPKMRVLYGTRVLEIDAVLDLEERGEAMQLLCTEAQ